MTKEKKKVQTFLHREIIAASPSSSNGILNNHYKEIRTSSQRKKFMSVPLKRESKLLIFCYLSLAIQKHNVYKLNTLWRVWWDFLFNRLSCWLLLTDYRVGCLRHITREQMSLNMLAETNKGQLERQLPHQVKASNARTSLQQTPAEQIQYSVSFHIGTAYLLLSIYVWIQHHHLTGCWKNVSNMPTWSFKFDMQFFFKFTWDGVTSA